MKLILFLIMTVFATSLINCAPIPSYTYPAHEPQSFPQEAELQRLQEQVRELQRAPEAAESQQRAKQLAERREEQQLDEDRRRAREMVERAEQEKTSHIPLQF